MYDARTVLLVLSLVFSILGAVCSIIILIDAFKSAIWKGLVSILCGFYFIYYALAEFKHEKKWLIVAGSLLGGGIGGALYQASVLGSR